MLWAVEMTLAAMMPDRGDRHGDEERGDDDRLGRVAGLGSARSTWRRLRSRAIRWRMKAELQGHGIASPFCCTWLS